MVLFSSLQTPAIIVQWNFYPARRWEGLYAVQVVRAVYGQTRFRNSLNSVRKAPSFLFCVKCKTKNWHHWSSCLFQLQYQRNFRNKVYCYNFSIFSLLLLFFWNIDIVIIFSLIFLPFLIFYLTTSISVVWTTTLRFREWRIITTHNEEDFIINCTVIILHNIFNILVIHYSFWNMKHETTYNKMNNNNKNQQASWKSTHSFGIQGSIIKTYWNIRFQIAKRERSIECKDVPSCLSDTFLPARISFATTAFAGNKSKTWCEERSRTEVPDKKRRAGPFLSGTI